jgi:lipopolysaccharide transport system ATP-binding protein
MQDVSQGQGRTVLFVSHNMHSMLMLCKNGVLLEHGQIKSIGNIATIVDQYINEDTSKSSIEMYYKEKEKDPDITANYIRISSFKLLDEKSVAIHQGKRLKGRITIYSLLHVKNVRFRITILNMSGSAISMSTMREELQVIKGETTFDFQLDTSMLASGTYSLSFALVINDKQVIDVVRKGFYFEIISNPQLMYNVDWQPQWFGNISGFELKRIDGFS